MKLQIRKLILWPKNGGKYRELEFKPGSVNVISGSSKAGKSAVIPIIDYCLCSELCAIPVGTIRKTCKWFGILVETDEGQKLIARIEPGSQRSTDDMFIIEGQVIEIPEIIEHKNTNRNNVKEILNRLSGLPNIGFGDDPSEFGFKNRPSFRDLMAFTFQPQNIVANPDVLFYKADSYGNREKLKSIFPFILGAIESKTLQIVWELKELRKQLKILQSELTAIDAVSKQWQAEANVWFYRSREYGLAAEDAQPHSEWSRLLEQLKGIAYKSSRDAVVTPVAIESSSEVLTALSNRETLMAENILIAKLKLDDLKEIKAEATNYSSSLVKIEERLGLSTWLKELAENNHSANPLSFPGLDPSSQLSELCNALEDIERVARSAPKVSASVEGEIVRIRNLIRQDSETLAAIRTEIKGIEAKDEFSAKHALRMTEIDRFLGSMQQSIKTYTEARSDSELTERVKALEARIKALEPQVSDAAVKLKTTNSLQEISDICALITPHLDAEWAEAKITLSIPDLAIKVKHDGREDFLWEIGSGANWLAYHIATLLALQLYFLKKTDHSVPHLLIFDQPSQVYFPVKSAVRKDRDENAEEIEPILDDEDRDAVRKVFSVLARGVIRAKGRLQIIVLDHAGSEVWGGIEGVSLAEEWRDGEKLVPPRFED